MTELEIQAALDELAASMVEKGIKTPRADFTLKSGGGVYAYIRGEYGTTPFDGRETAFARGETAEEALAEARRIIAALPDPEEATSREYLRHVAKAVDFATEHSIDERYVAPLRGVSKAMTDNLLTNQGVAS